MAGIVPRLQAYVCNSPIIVANPRVKALLEHPAGPFTIHFHAPAFKWFISLANVADLQRSPETLSLPQQIAIAATGLVWSRYSMVINPVNWNLLSVNIFMAGTGLYQLARIATHDPAAATEGEGGAAAPTEAKDA